jgi:hypothetical protein
MTMRAARLLCGLTVLVISGPWARADSAANAPYEATIMAPEAEVRCGPSADAKYYATSKLRQGEKVQVLREEDGGWLAIKPPPGSFSWINTRFIELVDQDRGGRVLADDAPVRIGSAVVNTPPTVEAKSRLKRGFVAIVLDAKKVAGDDGTWLPIVPGPDEVRYIAADSVKSQPQVQRVQASPAAQMPAGPPSPAPAGSDEALWEQAHQAEVAGKPADAADLFYQLANRTQNHELQVRCYNRIHFLREGMKATAPQNYQSGHPTEAHYPQQNVADPRVVPTPYVSGQPQFAPPGQVTSQYSGQAPGQLMSSNPAIAPGGVAPGNAVNSSGPGVLRRAPFFIDQKVTYVLESSNGVARMYVSPQPGLNLEYYIGRNVDLVGVVQYRGDVKTYLMQATNVRLLQQ